MKNHSENVIHDLKDVGFELVRRTKHGDLLKKDDKTVLVSRNVRSPKKARSILRKALQP